MAKEKTQSSTVNNNEKRRAIILIFRNNSDNTVYIAYDVAQKLGFISDKKYIYHHNEFVDIDESEIEEYYYKLNEQQFKQIIHNFYYTFKDF